MDLSTYGLPVLLLARLGGVHIDTARRWKRRGEFPRRLMPLVELLTTGNLGVICEAWDGFRLSNGVLWTPESESLRPGDLRAIPLRAQQLQALERELREANKQIKPVSRCRRVPRIRYSATNTLSAD